ncbi:hypothetical protein ACU635_36275 [[Actinomadura] parvosata]|uniref:hypothetical protein n=1 Tax=[Actinomadura] parvosata TaxID=1955412 RepID=UPI00406CA70C
MADRGRADRTTGRIVTGPEQATGGAVPTLAAPRRTRQAGAPALPGPGSPAPALPADGHGAPRGQHHAGRVSVAAARRAEVLRVEVEDDALLREGLAVLLGGEGFGVVAAVANPQEFLASVARHSPVVAMMDVRMPPTHRPALPHVAVVDVRVPPAHTDEGIRVAVEAGRSQPGPAVLGLSAYVEQAFAAELLAGGARGVGCLLKERVGQFKEFMDAPGQLPAYGCPAALRRKADGISHPGLTKARAPAA